MSNTAEMVAEMVDMLPDEEQTFAFELIKRLVQAWDPDFTKVTSSEAASIDAGFAEIARGDTVSHDDINWD